MKEDLIDLLLYLAQQQVKGAESRNDNLINLLVFGGETITCTDEVSSTTLNDHPVKWDEFAWSLFTWG